MEINKLANKIHANARKKGWWDKKRNEGEILMLVITELSEALEADRMGKIGNDNIDFFEESINSGNKPELYKIELFERLIKDTVADELADAFIRMCDYCKGFKVKINEKRLIATLEILNKDKMKNFGEELLKVCGNINFLYKGIVKSITSEIILAKLIWIADQKNIDLEKHIKYKMWYNTTRDKLHGKKY